MKTQTIVLGVVAAGVAWYLYQINRAPNVAAPAGAAVANSGAPGTPAVSVPNIPLAVSPSQTTGLVRTTPELTGYDLREPVINQNAGGGCSETIGGVPVCWMA